MSEVIDLRSPRKTVDLQVEASGVCPPPDCAVRKLPLSGRALVVRAIERVELDGTAPSGVRIPSEVPLGPDESAALVSCIMSCPGFAEKALGIQVTKV